MVGHYWLRPSNDFASSEWEVLQRKAETKSTQVDCSVVGRCKFSQIKKVVQEESKKKKIQRV